MFKFPRFPMIVDTGQTENYAYAGMYWTWGGKDDKGKDDDKKDSARKNWIQGLMRAADLNNPWDAAND